MLGCIKIIFIIIIFIIIYEIVHGYKRQKERYIYYQMAKKRAIELNKPLIVYGDPYNGNGSKLYNKFMKTYGCGDETVDLTGCPSCPNGKKQDILSHLKSQNNNSCIIFISCVLEYVNEIDQVIPEIYRVAGDWKNIFIVSIGENTLSAHFYKDKNDVSKNIVYAPPKYKNITYKKI